MIATRAWLIRPMGVVEDLFIARLPVDVLEDAIASLARGSQPPDLEGGCGGSTEVEVECLPGLAGELADGGFAKLQQVSPDVGAVVGDGEHGVLVCFSEVGEIA